EPDRAKRSLPCTPVPGARVWCERRYPRAARPIPSAVYPAGCPLPRLIGTVPTGRLLRRGPASGPVWWRPVARRGWAVSGRYPSFLVPLIRTSEFHLYDDMCSKSYENAALNRHFRAHLEVTWLSQGQLRASRCRAPTGQVAAHWPAASST